MSAQKIGGRSKARARGNERKKKEMSEIQRLKNENIRLKRQLTRLRKELARVNMDRFDNVREALEVQDREDAAFQQIEKEKKLVEHWQCFKCREDYLRLIIIERPDGAFYFRKCPACENRTRLKALTDSVEGPAA